MTKTTTRLSPVEVEDRLEDAARTLRRLPAVRVPGYISAWPPIVRSAAEAYGWENATAPRTLKNPNDMRIVWLRAEGVRWKPICWQIGISRTTAWQRWAAAMITIANRHNTSLIQPSRKPSRKSMAALGRTTPRESVL